MKLIYQGKTKDVYQRSDGKLEFHFKDTATGSIQDGKTVFDPGQDAVAGTIKGKGRVSCVFSTYFFKLLKDKNISSHYVTTKAPNVMVVKKAELLGKGELYNLEFVYRNNAFGSFLRRYPFVESCRSLHGLVEVTTKGETDQLITDDALINLEILTKEELQQAKRLVKKIGKILIKEFSAHQLHLIDFKVELGRIRGKITLIDDISPDVLRACQPAQASQVGKRSTTAKSKQDRVSQAGKDTQCQAACDGAKVLSPLELYQAMPIDQ